MKFRYPTDKEFEMVEKFYFFENTKFYGVSPLNRYMLSYAKAYPEWIKKNACDAFVTEDGQGFCGLTPNIDGSKYVHAIWVNENYRGKGCGKALIEHAKTLSPKGLTLHVNIQNPKALCLYNKCGFKVAAMEGPDEDHNLFWRIYMETKDGLKGRECDTLKYEFPTKEMIEGRMGTNQMMTNIFPTILMILQFVAAIPYAIEGNARMTVYWIAAGVLTLALTYL